MSKIRVRINPISSNETEMEYDKNLYLKDYFDQVIKDFPNREEIKEYFKIFINGYEIDEEYWAYAKPKEDAEVLIAVVPKGGEFGQIFKQIAIIAVVVAVSVATRGIATPGVAPLLVAASAVGATLLFNALIPPLDNSQNFGFGSLEDIEQSQMYTFSGQSNQLKKYGNVPKVYGSHRIFPNVAANPFTTIETDPVTGELVQYFYAIYDFGFGPNQVRNIQIGDTPIESFNDVQYHLVDINKPSISEGYWDDEVQSSFTLYKGDNTQTAVSVNFTKNSNDVGATPAEYQAIRNASQNLRNEPSEIVSTIAFGNGLNTYATNGNSDTRNVEVKMEFAEVGTEDWHNFDDLNYVDDFDQTILAYQPIFMPPGSWNDSLSDSIGLVKEDLYDWFNNPYGISNEFLAPLGFTSDPNAFLSYFPAGNYYYRLKYYGIIAGQTTRIPLENKIPVGQQITIDNSVIGTVTGHSAHPGGFWHYITPAKFTRALFWDIERWVYNVGYDASYWTDFKLVGDNWQFNEMNSSGGVSRFKAKAGNNGINVFFGNRDTPLYGTFRFRPKTTNSIKLRMTRIRSYGGYSFRVIDNLTWVDNVTRFFTDTINTDKRHTFIELRIKATDQLSGNIKNLNAICTSVLDIYDDVSQTWSKDITRNPAWIFADILTGEVNKRAFDKSKLDVNSLKSWADFADEIPTAPPNMGDYLYSRFQCNFILDFNSTISQLLEQVAGSSQASLNIVDGKYGVLIDREVTIPVQMFTARNSWNFQSTKKFARLPDGFKVKYVAPQSNWEVKEQPVYNDGFDALTAVEFEELTTFGVTNWEQAWRYGRYMLAQAKLRQETITIDVDFEHLVCTRGDYVLFSNDVMKVGGVPARVKTVVGNQITIDDEFSTQPLINYGYTYRNKFGQMKTSTMTIVAPDTANLDGDIPEVDDLILWGEVDKITYECIVKAIIPKADLTAQLVLVEKNNAIFASESSQDIPGYDPRISTVTDIELQAPAAVENLAVDDNSYDCDGLQYQYFIDLSWEIPLGTIYELFEVYVDYGVGYQLDGYTNTLDYHFIVNQANLAKEHKFKVIAVSSSGAKIALGEAIEVSATPLAKTSPPTDVEALYINITNESLTLEWPLIEDCDVLYYLIRYSPNLVSTWEKSIPLDNVSANTKSMTTQARVGSYYIKAVDFAGNESVNAALAKTSIPALVNLNVVDETNDFPTFPGSLDRVVDIGQALVLEELVAGVPPEYYDDGEYFYNDILDLGDIYTTRLQSLIDAEGYTPDDVMANWTTLADVTFLSTSTVSDWDVETYYRGRDSLSVIANWVTLAGILQMSAGEEGEWTSWRKFTIGDFTARYFQFKLKLISNKDSVSPRVFDAKIRADMPDRVENINNLTAPASGLRVNYSPAFKGPGTTPFVGITQDAAQKGDRYVITNKDLTGFDIQFFDNSDVAVSRQFDALIKGYGRLQTATI